MKPVNFKEREAALAKEAKDSEVAVKKTDATVKSEDGSEEDKSKCKFNCKSCSFATNELAEWVSHRRLHQSQGDARQVGNITLLSFLVVLGKFVEL